MDQQHAHWIAQAAMHWREHQPRRYKALKAAGTLAATLREAAEAAARDPVSELPPGGPRSMLASVALPRFRVAQEAAASASHA